MRTLLALLWQILAWITGRKPGKSPPEATRGETPVPASEEPGKKKTPVASSKASEREPWMAFARAELGVKETPGAADNDRVLAYYRDAGHPEVENDSVAWCAAFTGAMLERAGMPSSKQLTAQSYRTWGKRLPEPKPGCVVVMRRGNSSWQGHVGFCVGVGKTHVDVLGGNQGDAVTVQSFPKSGVFPDGYRWPVTPGNSRTIRASNAGLLTQATSLAGSGSLLAIGSEVKSLGDVVPWLLVVGSVITILALMVPIWARTSDLAEKGR